MPKIIAYLNLIDFLEGQKENSSIAQLKDKVEISQLLLSEKKEYEKAIEYFMKSSEICFAKGFDRFGVSALDYAKDCQNALGNTTEVEALAKKIKEVKTKLESAF